MVNTNLVIQIVPFKISKNTLFVLLQNNSLLNCKIDNTTLLDEYAKEIFSKTLNFDIQSIYGEQLYTFSEVEKNEISVVYYFLLPDTNIDISENMSWFEAKKVDKNFRDYAIIQYAIQRLQWKIEYTNVVYSLLPDTFTLSELQEVYETILDKKLDKRNFRKKILSLDFIKPTAQKRTAKARPAILYKFKEKKPQIVKVF